MNEHASVAGGIAIVGLAGRFPDAPSVRHFWNNLYAGVESIRFLNREQLEASGVDPELIGNPEFVPATTIVENMDRFDAGFFGFSPREAAITDPQHRVFLECAWEALEDAGHVPERYEGRIGVFAGSGVNMYANTLNRPDIVDSVGGHVLTFANDKDYLAVRVSYKLNLRGPSVTVQTACSTSLTAVHFAAESILRGECDMALAGAVSLSFGQTPGYVHVPGMILSPDGHCRAFDAKAAGTVFSRGAAVVVLKRLEAALADRDHIYAVLRSTAINNDGASKVGFSAPSVDGQAEVVRMAQRKAGFSPEDIAFIEAHGTGTELGDPIEVRALEQVFRERTTKKGYCAIGSVKSNVGHMDTVAGSAGLIKAVLALEHRVLPPTLHFDTPNPHIDFAASPFYVAQAPVRFSESQRLRAGVSAFGIGGTNVHACLEEAPQDEERGATRAWQFLPVTARSQNALSTLRDRLAAHFEEHPDIHPADAAYTLQAGRRHFEHRAAILCDSLASASTLLRQRSGPGVVQGTCRTEPPKVVFLFPGQGTQHPQMARGVYESHPAFRSAFDTCCEILEPLLGIDLRHILYNEDADAAARLQATSIAQPAIFAVEYALAKLWMRLGVKPSAMIGHSIGEFVAACLAGVFSLEDALALVAARGKLMQDMPVGAMLAVRLSEADTAAYLTPNVAIAAINAPEVTVLSGAVNEIEMLDQLLTGRGIGTSRLHTSHAFHSVMMEPAAAAFREHIQRVRLSAPALPYISNVTGDWITPEQATDPDYWCTQLRQAVRFGDGLARVAANPESILLEVGPGQSVSSLAQIAGIRNTRIPSLPHQRDDVPEEAAFLGAVAQLWVEGVEVDYTQLGSGQDRRRIPLPTYPFERQRYLIEPDTAAASSQPRAKRREIADWFYVPSWRRMPAVKMHSRAVQCWMILLDDYGIGERLAGALEQRGEAVVRVSAGSEYAAHGRGFTIRPATVDDYERLFDALELRGEYPEQIVHFWSVRDEGAFADDRGYLALTYLAQAHAARGSNGRNLQISVVANSLHDVTGEKILHPERALALGICRVLPLEQPDVGCRVLDIALGDSDVISGLLAEVLSATRPGKTEVVALRRGYRWIEALEPLALDTAEESERPIRKNGVYLITGGLGGLGLTFATFLARTVQARLVLTGRTPFPSREEWSEWNGNGRIKAIIEQLQEMERTGGEVMVCQADVADKAQMGRVIASVQQRFGRIDGVIHAAGVPGAGVIAGKIPDVSSAVLAPKVQGTLVLDELLRDTPLDFLVLCSSIDSAVGIPGQCDSSAASSFLDAFAQERSRRLPDQRTISVNWDLWREVGMGVNIALPPAFEHRRAQMLSTAIAPAEGVEALRRVLATSLPRVVVSTRDPGAVQASVQRPASAMVLEDDLPSLSSTGTNVDSTAAYVSPEDEIESTVATIWEEILGIPRVGMNDNFFELGGHSLLGTQLLSRIRSRLDVALPLRAVFEARTARALSDRIKIVKWAAAAHSTVPEGDREEVEI